MRNRIKKRTIEYLEEKSRAAVLAAYNTISPLPRGVRMKTGMAWCAAFVSAVMHDCRVDYPFECSCGRMIEKAQKMGIFVENDSFTPRTADVILYDWQDSGTGDNRGWPDHVGIVEKVENGIITVIEGNLNNAVGRRRINVNAPTIRGYITPRYTPDTPDSGAQTTPEIRRFPKYQGASNSIVDALKAVGAQSSFAYRKTIANANGLLGYSGTAEQNVLLLKKLKNGMLIMP